MSVTKVHHLNCGTMRPPGHRIRALLPDHLVAHILLIETDQGLVLVDSGFGLADVGERGARLGRQFVALVGAALLESETAIRQIEALGYSPTDVTDIVLTHLDLDHAGGISDFPGARVHVSDAELDAALRPAPREKLRYVGAQWAHGPSWATHTPGGDEWHGFASVQVIADDIVMIPLRGHTRGHSGVAVRNPDGGWLLHAGDAYFDDGDKLRPRQVVPGLRVFQRLMAVDNTARLNNLARLQDLHATSSREVTIFSAHDANEFAALA